MQNVSIGDLVIHDLSGPGDIWLQTPVEGFEAPEYRITEYDRSGEDGGYISSMLYSSRAISLPGMFQANNAADYEARRIQLIGACSIQRDEFGQPLPTRISLTTLSGKNYFVNAYFNKPLINYDGVNWGRFMIQARIPDPFIYAPDQVTSIPLMVPSGGGFLSPFLSPFLTSASSGGSVNVDNTGKVAVSPKLQLSGTLTNPYVYNATSGQSMRLNYTLNSGDTIIIDMREKTITLNSSSSLLSAKTSDSTWWSLMPGQNSISLKTDIQGDDGNVILSYYPAFTGI